MYMKVLFSFLFIAVATDTEAALHFEEEAKELVAKFTGWVNKKEYKLNYKLEHALENLMKHQKWVVEHSIEKLQIPLTSVEKDLTLWKTNFPKNCFEAAKSYFLYLQKTSSNRFITCYKDSEYYAESKNLTLKATNVSSAIADLFQTVLAGLVHCKPYVQNGASKCVNDYVLKVVQSFKTDLHVMENYLKELNNVEFDLTTHADRCVARLKPQLNKLLTDLIATLNVCTL